MTLDRDQVQIRPGDLSPYMAHEQRVAPHEATSASDIYALGVSWYEMLTGDTPDVAVVAAKAFPDPCSDSEANALIRHMLECDPAKRPTATEVVEQVLLSGTGGSASS